MKKLALSIAVAAIAATGVQAETIVETNSGLTVDLGAKVELEAVKEAVEDAELGYNVDDAEFNMTISSDMDSGVVLFGYFESDFAGESEADDAVVTLGDAYVGATIDAVTVKFGQTATAADDFGIGMDEYQGIGNAEEFDWGYEVVRVEYSADAYTVIAAADLDENDDGSGIDVMVSADVMDGLTVAGLVQIADTDSDYTVFGVSASYSMDAITVAGEFSTETEEETTAWQIAGSYAVTDAATVAAGFGDPDTDADDDEGYYVNASYALTDYVTAKTEVFSTTADGAELGFYAGMSVSF